MKHFYTNVSGFFGPSQKLLYTNQVQQAKDGFHFVEVGAWKGRSSSFMSVEIINSGKKIKFDVVDTWLGSSEDQRSPSVKKGILYEEYLQNTKPVSHIVNPIRMTSVEASKLYDDNSLDFVFIDAGHEYNFVKEDIEHWFPKVREFGIIAGDDYEYGISWGDDVKNFIEVIGLSWGDGVKKAVNEILKKPIIDREVWIYRK